jgi:hypothetical protein
MKPKRHRWKHSIKVEIREKLKRGRREEVTDISGFHGGEYEDCLLGCCAV